MDRPEYWVAVKDVASHPRVGDELSFRVNGDGSVEFSKNGSVPSVILYVDVSRPLYAFWDIFGHTSKIRLVGSTTAPFPGTEGLRTKIKLESPDSGIDLSLRQEQQQPSECVICFENGNLIFLIVVSKS